MPRFHINPTTGEPGQCRAQQTCPFGSSEEHHDSAAQAREAFEAQQTNTFLPPARKSSLEPLTPLETATRSFFDGAVTDYAHEIEFLDHNSLSEYDDNEDYTTLAAMDSFEKAQNNCDSASSQLLEELAPGELREAGFASAELKTLTFEDGSPHVALALTTHAGERVIVDYTARQYASSLAEEASIPWPLVKEEAEWERIIEEKALSRWGLQVKRESPPATVASVRADLQRRHPGIELDLSEKAGGYVVLDRIVVPKGEQKTGRGSQVLEELVRTADEQGWRLALTPSTDFGATSRARLERFYRRFGFVPNRGRAKDFTTMEAMVRQPQ